MLAFASRYVLALAFCCLVAMPDPINAQTPQSATPEAAAQALFTALSEDRWLDAARLVHPEALTRFREQKLMELRNIREPKPMTAADYRRGEPEMPDAVAEYMAKRANQVRNKPGSRIAYEFAGVSSVAELERLSAEEMMARWFQAQHPAYKMEQAIKEIGRPLPPEAAGQMPGRVERTILGTTPAQQADSIAYVVHRTVWLHGEERAPHSPLGVLVMRRTPVGWRVDPTQSSGHDPFDTYFSFGWDEVEDLRETVKQVVAWPSQAAPEGRAFLTGYGEDPMKSPPKALVIEQLGKGNRKQPLQRVEIPAAAFEELADLLMRWGWMAHQLRDALSGPA